MSEAWRNDKRISALEINEHLRAEHRRLLRLVEDACWKYEHGNRGDADRAMEALRAAAAEMVIEKKEG